MTSAELSIVIRAKNEASAILKDVEGSVSKLGGVMGTALKVGAVAAGAGIIGAGLALKGFVDDAMEAQKVGAQTAAVLQSTHGAAGMTADSVANLANELSRFTPYDDEAIQSAENLLLTFTSIGKDVFPQATETVLNMSTALGQDLKSSAIQLGKAMNDPITGATALRRVGVALTEQQINQIKVFQESGDLMSAQSIIMKELQTEFGGSAKAAGSTFAGQMTILGTQIDNVKERIGMALIPILTQLAGVAIQYVVPAIERGITALSDFADFIKSGLTGDVQGAAEAFGKLPEPLQVLAMWLHDNKEAIIEFGMTVKELAIDVLEGWKKILIALGPKLVEFGKFLAEHKPLLIALAVAVGVLLVVFASLPVAIATIIIAGGLLAAHWDDIKAKAVELWQSFQDNFGLIYLVVVFYFETIKNVVTTALNVVRDIFRIVMAVIHGDWSEAWAGIKQLASDVWDGIVTDIGLKLGYARDVVVYGLAVIVGWFKGLAGRALDAIGDLSGVLRDAGVQIITGLWDGMKSKWDDVKRWLGGLAGQIKRIKGPIDVDRQMLVPEAKAIMQGFQGGLLAGWKPVERTLAGFSAKMPGTLTGGAVGGAAAANGGQAVGGGAVYHIYINTYEQHGDAQAGLAALGAAV